VVTTSLQHGLVITKFHCAITYTPECAYKQFSDEVSDARRAGDIDKAFELITETSSLGIAHMVKLLQIKNFLKQRNDDNISKNTIIHILQIQNYYIETI
jgi:hypothetical protein